MADRAQADAAISIHALLVESDNIIAKFAMLRKISIHALLAESDYPSAGCHPRAADFYPRSPCGERRTFLKLACIAAMISIHALLAESDDSALPAGSSGQRISIHALLAESD